MCKPPAQLASSEQDLKSQEKKGGCSIFLGPLVVVCLLLTGHGQEVSEKPGTQGEEISGEKKEIVAWGMW